MSCTVSYFFKHPIWSNSTYKIHNILLETDCVTQTLLAFVYEFISIAHIHATYKKQYFEDCELKPYCETTQHIAG